MSNVWHLFLFKILRGEHNYYIHTTAKHKYTNQHVLKIIIQRWYCSNHWKQVDTKICQTGFFFFIKRQSFCCDYGLCATKHYPLSGYNVPEVVKNEVRVGLSSSMILFCFDKENNKLKIIACILNNLAKTGHKA